MDRRTYFFLLLSILASIVLLLPDGLYAQGRITYRDLLNRSNMQHMYFDHIQLPTQDSTKVHNITIFRLEYDLLSFKKTETSRGNNDAKYYAPVRLHIEFFKSDQIPEDDRNLFGRNKRNKEDFSIKGMEPMGRDYWIDTVFVNSFEETNSRSKHIEGILNVELSPSRYAYVLQMNRADASANQFSGGEPDKFGRGLSRNRFMDVHHYDSPGFTTIYLIDTINRSGSAHTLELLNFGDNVYYGQDYNILVPIANYSDEASYKLSISQLDVSDNDTSAKQTIYSQSINESHLLKNSTIKLGPNKRDPSLTVKENIGDRTFALLNIPNSKFKNGAYRLKVESDQHKHPVAQKMVRSKWVDMPTSLYNIDVALNMLRYIVDEEKLKQMREGNDRKKQQAFYDFWDERDPTPDTEFNELMAEYYRRVDYAFNEFSTPQAPGYNTDQGKVYISYGPPNKVERKFPTDGRAIEVWKYPNKTIRFRATSGFGDFKLIESDNK